MECIAGNQSRLSTEADTWYRQVQRRTEASPFYGPAQDQSNAIERPIEPPVPRQAPSRPAQSSLDRAQARVDSLQNFRSDVAQVRDLADHLGAGMDHPPVRPGSTLYGEYVLSLPGLTQAAKDFDLTDARYADMPVHETGRILVEASHPDVIGVLRPAHEVGNIAKLRDRLAEHQRARLPVTTFDAGAAFAHYKLTIFGDMRRAAPVRTVLAEKLRLHAATRVVDQAATPVYVTENQDLLGVLLSGIPDRAAFAGEERAALKVLDAVRRQTQPGPEPSKTISIPSQRSSDAINMLNAKKLRSLRGALSHDLDAAKQRMAPLHALHEPKPRSSTSLSEGAAPRTPSIDDLQISAEHERVLRHALETHYENAMQE